MEIYLLSEVSIETIDRMLSHTDVKMAQIYAKTSGVIICRDVARLSEILAEN